MVRARRRRPPPYSPLGPAGAACSAAPQMGRHFGGGCQGPRAILSTAPGTVKIAASATIVGPVGTCQNQEST